MVNSRASKGLQLIGTYIASTTEASKIFTLSEQPGDFNKLILVIKGTASGALELQLIINSIETSTYYADGRRIMGGTETLIDTGAEEYHVLLSATVIEAARTFEGTAEIYLPSSDVNFPSIHSLFSSASKQGQEQYTGTQAEAQTSITEIEIQTSTSTWKAGTTISLYRMKP